MTSKAERRRRARQNRKGPSLPRQIGANDNIDTANDNLPAVEVGGVTREPGVKETPGQRIFRQMQRRALDEVPKPVRSYDPGRLTSEQEKQLRRAEEKLKSGDPRKAAAARDTIGQIERSLQRRVAETQRTDSRLEAAALASARGDEIEIPHEGPADGPKPMRRVAGLDWLWKKGRLTVEAMRAGLRYADDWRQGDAVSVKSCLAEAGGGDGLEAQERRYEAQKRLRAAREALGSPGRVGICDRVCGEGKRVREIAGGNDRLSIKIEAALLESLGILSRHYGMESA